MKTSPHRSVSAAVLATLVGLTSACSGSTVVVTATATETTPAAPAENTGAAEPTPVDTSDDSGSYLIVDTNQTTSYNNTSAISAPSAGSAFYGQDSQNTGNQPSYTDNGDGTVTDNVTGLTWWATADLNGDGTIDIDDKLTYSEAAAMADSVSLAGYDDWRLPTTKELYSLIDFSGTDVGPDGGGSPFIDTSVFGFAYGDTSAGERDIDAQWVTSTLYTDSQGPTLMFGVNFADGRIKGYGIGTGNGGPQGEKEFYVYWVRGNTDYGENAFVDNGDGTITDTATTLMWAQDDSGDGMNWEEALAWAEEANASNYLGYSDWRVPNAKELQSIVDYSRSPGSTNSAAIDPIFDSTPITAENGRNDWGFYWTSTTHASAAPNREGSAAVYVAFGRAYGYMNGNWVDVHGAGAQRSDPKTGSADDYPTGHGPQGDAIRVENLVRLVRDA